MKKNKFDKIKLTFVIIWIFFVLLFLSGRQPFYLDESKQLFSNFFCPVIVFLFLIYLSFRKNDRGIPLFLIYNGSINSFGKGLKSVLLYIISIAIFSYLAGSSLQGFLAYPTKFIASNKFSTNGVVVDSYEYLFSFRGLNEIELISTREKQKIKFLWPTISSHEVGKGGCIDLVGRDWFFGSYVDEVRVVKCHQ